ncbi:MAG: sporulation protein YqfD [Eubacteriales bacterium]|nr:sporulation protein YqfD [Eubacteriales bacterium]
MWYKLLNKITGWYLIKTPEEQGARLLNALNEDKVLFWGMKSKDGWMYVRFSAFSCAHGLKAAEKAGIEASLEKAIGLPFIIYKYRKRHGLVAGTALGLMLILISTLHVWKINITGNNEIPDKVILSALSEAGIDIGTYIPTIRPNSVRTSLILNLTELSSASVNIKGNHITVEVIERKRPPDFEDYSGFFNVVASRDGYIVSVEAYSGKPLVKKGDVVVKGQLLIAGQYPSYRGITIATHARGSVQAVIYQDFVTSVPLDFQYKLYTGNTDTKISYNILGSDINLFLGAPVPFVNYDAQISKNEVAIGFLKLPVVKTTLFTREYVKQTMEITVDEAKQKALAAFNSWCESDTEGPVLKRNYEIIYDEVARCVTITGTAEVLVDIAEEVPFDPIYEPQSP